MVDMILLANLGMLSLVIGTIPSIWSAIKNRNNLRGFSMLGAIGVMVGQSIYFVYFMLLNDYLTTMLSVPLLIYWAIVLIYTLKDYLKGVSK